MKKVSIVIPAFNEAGNIFPMYEAISSVFEKIDYSFEVIFVDDGSSDDTLSKIQKLAELHKNVYFIELSRNFGHQSALKSGLDHAQGDCIISMDSDMQHPPDLIPVLIQKWEEGYDIVYTRRKEVQQQSFLKRKTSVWFYRLLNKLSGIQLEEGTADFRLMDKRAVHAFSALTENDLFIRGIVKWMGFRQFAIDYVPNQRLSGTTKYTFSKMFSLALKGVTSFSVSPLYTAIYLGFFMSFAALLYLPYVLYSYFTDHTASGWSSVILTIVFFGGVQMILLGILGIYVGKLFMQSKHRPTYIVRNTNIE